MSTTLSTEETERRSKRRRVEIALFSLESDLTRLSRQEEAASSVLHQLRQNLREHEARVAEQEQELASISAHIAEKQAEVNHAKKEMRLL